MIVVAITGASGVVYGKRLLEVLNEMRIDTAVVLTDPAKIILEYELQIGEEDIKNLATEYYHSNDLTTSINSGSFQFDAIYCRPVGDCGTECPPVCRKPEAGACDDCSGCQRGGH